MPSQPLGRSHALSYASEAIDYNWYIGLVSQSVAVDLRILIQAVAALVEDENLRRSLGERGRALAAANYDWSVVFDQYRALWAELLALRMISQGSQATKAPRTCAAQLDPYGLFGHYATFHINGNTKVSLMDTAKAWKTVADDSLFRMSHNDRPPDAHFEAIISELRAAGKSTISKISDRIHVSLEDSILIVSYLAKWGVIDLWPDSRGAKQHY
jgi:starch synthase